MAPRIHPGEEGVDRGQCMGAAMVAPGVVWFQHCACTISVRPHGIDVLARPGRHKREREARKSGEPAVGVTAERRQAVSVI